MGIPEVEQVEHVGEKVDLIVDGAECVQSEVCCRRRVHHQTSCERDELVADAEDCCKGSTEPHRIDLLGQSCWWTGYGAMRHERSVALSTSRVVVAIVLAIVAIVAIVRVRVRVHNPPPLARARGDCRCGRRCGRL